MYKLLYNRVQIFIQMVKNLAERESKGHSLPNLELINIFQCLKNRWLNCR